MPKGTVKTFSREQGFGTLVLESGDEVPFDISVSNKQSFELGAVADVTVGVGYGGRTRAKLVLFELEEDRAPSFTAGFKQLRTLGFFLEWELNQAKAAAKALFEEVPARLSRSDVGGLLQQYYDEGLSARGRAEGVITLDWRFGQVTQTPAEDLLAITGAASHIVLAHAGDRVVVDGEAVDLTEGLLPLVGALNAASAARGVPRRLFSLDVEADFYVIVCRDADFARQIGELSVLRLG